MGRNPVTSYSVIGTDEDSPSRWHNGTKRNSMSLLNERKGIMMKSEVQH